LKTSADEETRSISRRGNSLGRQTRGLDPSADEQAGNSRRQPAADSPASRSRSQGFPADNHEGGRPRYGQCKGAESEAARAAEQIESASSREEPAHVRRAREAMKKLDKEYNEISQILCGSSLRALDPNDLLKTRGHRESIRILQRRA